MIEKYRIGVDIGGTFTDFVMIDTTSGRLFKEKLLTTPKDPSVAVLDGIGRMLAASGVRAEEAAIRKMTMRRLGQGDEDDKSARPIGWWRSEDVYAHMLDYPLHSAYPCAMNGAYERGRVRVNNLWGLYAEEFGRREHEARYYRDAIRRIEAQHARDVETPPSFDECLPRLIFPPWKQP